MKPRFFKIEEQRNWGGPDSAAHWLRLSVDLIDAAHVVELRELTGRLIAASPAGGQHQIRLEQGEVLGVPELAIAVIYWDDMLYVHLAAEDARVLDAVRHLEAGLEPLLRSLPIAANGRYLCAPAIPFVPGQRVRIVAPQCLEVTGHVLAIDSSTGRLKVRTSLGAWDSTLVEEIEVHFREVVPLASE